MPVLLLTLFFFFFNDTATTEIYTLSLHDALPISHHVLDLLPDAVEVEPEVVEHRRGNALALADDPEQQVLGADVVVLETRRFLARQVDALAAPLGEFVVHGDRGPRGSGASPA